MLLYQKAKEKTNDMDVYYTDGYCKNIKGQNTSNLLIRMILNKHYGLPEPIEIHIGSHGKPLLAPETGLHFSITHTGDRWMCSIYHERTGIDAELISRPVSKPETLARHFFSEKELAFIEQASDCSGIPAGNTDDPVPITHEMCRSMNMSQRLLFLWTQKEAVLKMNGDGLSGLRSCIVIPRNESAPVCTFLYRDLFLSVCTSESISPEMLNFTTIGHS